MTFLAGSRQGSVKQKNRSEVRGGAESRGDKKELEELELGQLGAQFGAPVVSRSLRDLETIVKN